jgi:hypothetical protein
MLSTSFDAGVPLRDVQEAASHADPRTTMRYDRARTSLDRHATYIAATVPDVQIEVICLPVSSVGRAPDVRSYRCECIVNMVHLCPSPACSVDYFMCGRIILPGGFALVVRALDLAFTRECVDDYPK